MKLNRFTVGAFGLIEEGKRLTLGESFFYLWKLSRFCVRISKGLELLIRMTRKL